MKTFAVEQKRRSPGALKRRATGTTTHYADGHEKRAAIRRILGLGGEGKTIPTALQTHFETHFGQDFSRVRVHVNEKDIGTRHAAAVTCGWKIAFAPGRWRPDTSAGRRLIAHELSHVVQQAGIGTGSPVGYGVAEHQAEQAASDLNDGRTVGQLGARPFGLPAASPPTGPDPASQTEAVPAADVERIVEEITRVVVAANLPGVDMAEVAKVLTALRNYGNEGKVVWGDTEKDVPGEYDHVPDVIILNRDRFNIRNPGHIAAVTLFHEASHTLRWRTGGRAADAAKIAETGPNPSLEDSYRAAVNFELKLYREEVLAHSIDQKVMFSYWHEIGIATRERAIQLVKEADPTTGSSAEKSFTYLGKLIMEFMTRSQRDVELDRFLKDAKAWGASGQNMPEFRQYIIP